MAEIVLDHVTKRFHDGTEAVRELSLEIADGELMVLVGPSGCGKSTALRMIAGLEDITDGELRIGGRTVNDVAPKGRDVAMVFQDYALYPHMTVRENMGYALKVAKVDRAEIDRRVQDAARTLDLLDHLDRRPRQLSGGQRQRVAMGRAIVRDPSAFLLDEPLSNLDAMLRVLMRTEIAALQNRLGTTMVYVTHDQTEAMTLGDRICVMRNGELQQVGTPQEVYEHPANIFVAGFIGSPAMNFLPATLSGDRLRLPILEAPIDDGVRERCGEGEAIVGIRPEHFEHVSLARETMEQPATFTARVEVLEWMGAELYAYLSLGDRDGEDDILGELIPETAAAAHRVAGQRLVVARLDPTSSVREGQEAELALDVAKLHVFDREGGACLSSPGARTATV
jgi:multiple sugar transport system ATP-binding protein